MATNSLPTKGRESLDAAPVSPVVRRRVRRPIAVLVFLGLAAWFAHFAYLRITVKPTPRPDYWEEKIAAIDPPGEGAISAPKAYLALVNRSWENDPEIRALDSASSPRTSLYEILAAPWDETSHDVALVSEVCASSAFDQARAGLLRVLRAGWVEDISATPAWSLPYPREHRAWVLWLLVHSRWQQEGAGEMSGAIEDWLAALRLAREWGRCRMVRVLSSTWRFQEFVAREMLLTARESHGPLDSLSLAREIDGLIPPRATLSELLEGERLRVHSSLEHTYVRDGGDWLVVSEASGIGSWRARGTPSRIWNLTSPLYHDLTTARRRVDEYFASLAELTSLACWAPSRVAQYEAEWRRLEPGPLEGFSPGVTGRISDYRLTAYYHMRGTMEAALAMLALAEYHRRHGNYPDSLDQLVPAFLPRVPVDYGDLQPLRYKRTGGDYILYGVGLDAEDNGGLGELDQGTYIYSHPDVVFSKARRVERQP